MSDVPAVTRKKWISQDELIAVLNADQYILLVQLGRMVHERDAANARAERLEALLARCRGAMWSTHNWVSPLRDEVDAALAQQPPPTGGHGAATLADTARVRGGGDAE